MGLWNHRNVAQMHMPDFIGVSHWSHSPWTAQVAPLCQIWIFRKSKLAVTKTAPFAFLPSCLLSFLPPFLPSSLNFLGCNTYSTSLAASSSKPANKWLRVLLVLISAAQSPLLCLKSASAVFVPFRFIQRRSFVHFGFLLCSNSDSPKLGTV